MATQVIMPQLGESVVEGTVTKWLRREGETVQEFDALLEVNTDKVDTEIPSPSGGTLLKILVPEGETVRAGTVIAWIGSPEEAVPGGASGTGSASGETPAPQAKAPTQAPSPQTASAALQPGRNQDLGFISPVVARMAREHNIDLAQVKGSGESGRITKRDVQAYLETRESQPSQSQPPTPKVTEQIQQAWETPADGDLFRPTELVFGKKETSAQPAPSKPAQPAAQPAAPQRSAPPTPALAGQVIPLSGLRRSIAEHMVASRRTSPHVTTVMEADMSRVTAHRAGHKAEFASSGVNLTFTAYLITAIVSALKAFPIVNSSWTDEGILVHPAVNVGMAVSLGDEGLIVPVIKGADELSLLGLARMVNDLAERARAHKLKPDEVQGGTFTLTNHGTTGSLFAMPIINQPQSAILGAGAIQKRAVVVSDERGDAITIRPMMYLSLTFDHRILDGASGDRFLAKVVDRLQSWV